MILHIIQIIVGLLISLFIPGFLVSLIFFKELEIIEKVGLGFVFSICIDIIIGLFLGYNESMKNFTGGITSFNLWIYLGTITIILFVVYAKKENLTIFKRLM